MTAIALASLMPIGGSMAGVPAMGPGASVGFDLAMAKAAEQAVASVAAEARAIEQVTCEPAMRDTVFGAAESEGSITEAISTKMDEIPLPGSVRISRHHLSLPTVEKEPNIASENIDREPANGGKIDAEYSPSLPPVSTECASTSVRRRKVEVAYVSVKIPDAPNSRLLPASTTAIIGERALPATGLAIRSSSETDAFAKEFEMVALGSSDATPPSPQTLERAVLNVHAERWIENMAREIAAAYSDDAETKIIRFRLSPEHLGTLEVEIAHVPGGLSIDISTNNADASKIIGTAEPKLIDELRSKGILLAESTLHSGANGDGNPHRNGAIPRSVLPSNDASREAVKDQDQHPERPKGRYA